MLNLRKMTLLCMKLYIKIVNCSVLIFTSKLKTIIFLIIKSQRHLCQIFSIHTHLQFVNRQKHLEYYQWDVPVKLFKMVLFIFEYLYIYAIIMYHFSHSESTKIPLCKFSKLHVFFKDALLSIISAAHMYKTMRSSTTAWEFYKWAHPCKSLTSLH